MKQTRSLHSALSVTSTIVGCITASEIYRKSVSPIGGSCNHGDFRRLNRRCCRLGAARFYVVLPAQSPMSTRLVKSVTSDVTLLVRGVNLSRLRACSTLTDYSLQWYIHQVVSKTIFSCLGLLVNLTHQLFSIPVCPGTDSLLSLTSADLLGTLATPIINSYINAQKSRASQRPRKSPQRCTLHSLVSGLRHSIEVREYRGPMRTVLPDSVLISAWSAQYKTG